MRGSCNKAYSITKFVAGNIHVEELNFLSAEPISDLRQQLKRKRHGRDDDDDLDIEDEEDTASERSGASGGSGGDNDLEAAVVAATAKADTTPPG